MQDSNRLVCNKNKDAQSLEACRNCHIPTGGLNTRAYCQSINLLHKPIILQKEQDMLKIDLVTGALGTGTSFKDPSTLADKVSMDQLIMIGMKNGYKIQPKQGKSRQVFALWMHLTNATGMLTKSKPVIVPHKKSINKVSRERVTNKIYQFTSKIMGPLEITGQLKEILELVVATKKLEFTKVELLNLLGSVKTKSHNVWANFNWYRNKILKPQGLME
jgi:hypothetical protein